MSFPTHWKMDNEICRNFVNHVDGIIIEDTAPIRLNDIDFYKANEARLCSLTSDVETLTSEYEHTIKCKQYNDVENQYYFSAGMLGVYGIPIDNHVSDNDLTDLKCSLYPKNYYERISSYLPVMDIDKLYTITIDSIEFYIDYITIMNYPECTMLKLGGYSVPSNVLYDTVNSSIVVCKQLHMTENQHDEETMRRLFMLTCELYKMNIDIRERRICL